ncbi:hypothetical protein OIU77_011162 [Salix suchowensis]|uniref:Uncharacterized protein n=1 Tax=Salix suchowensis TaxID=1278906 RepID=A0ABQ9AAT9_9ROSI|nr:hypothetical protein OIU77_011162 [Salix suchowensis]
MITQLIESHGFLDYPERGIDSDGNNNNLLDKLQDTIGKGQNPISILPYVGILGKFEVRRTRREEETFLQQQEELLDSLSMLLVKHDCVFGNDLDVDEITSVSEVLQKLNRPILYSVSPGVIPTPVMKKDISGLVNMYRVTGDDWDTWGDVAARFDVPRDFAAANKIGAKGLLGRSWPDLDMLPVGWLSNAGRKRAHGLDIKVKLLKVNLREGPCFTFSSI